MTSCAFAAIVRYAAAVASDVKAGEPKGVEILGMKLVLFRDPLDGNRVKAINDICPHRAAPLSSGWVESKEGHTCVVCPYHGWAFDGEGKLHDVPAADQVRHIHQHTLDSKMMLIVR